MTMQLATLDRNSFMQSMVTGLGGNATMRFYSGSRPSPASWTSGTTPLATLTFGSTAVTDSGGSVTSGALTFGAYTQNSATHVSGTPTWVALVTSANRCVATIDIGAGATNIQFSGAITTSQNVTGTLVLTDNNG